MTLTLHENRGPYVSQTILTFLELVDSHGRTVGQFIPHLEEYLFPYEFGGDVAHEHIRRLVGRIVARPLGQGGNQHLQQGVQAVAIQG